MSTHSDEHHQHHHADLAKVRCFVLTVSDSRTLEDDLGGAVVARMLVELGHELVGRALVRDEAQSIRRVVLDLAEGTTADVVVTTGGTGIALRDVTPEAVEPLFRCRLDGFGEAFRRRSFEVIGPEALLSRAVAGVIHHTLVFALPGSPEACRLAVSELVAPILGHAVGLLHGSAKPAAPTPQLIEPET
jgi:molybdenum cofactor biosynthesis protein B